MWVGKFSIRRDVDGVLVVVGGETAPLLQLTEPALDDVAALSVRHRTIGQTRLSCRSRDCSSVETLA